MYEFVFVEYTSEQPVCVVDRLRTLLDIATKLEKAGCTLRFTLTGIAFNFPSKEWFEEESLRAKLDALGITEEVSFDLSRTPEEVGDALGEFFDLVWYERKLVMMNEPDYDPKETFRDCPDIFRDMLKNMQRIEQEHGDEEFTAEDDFDWGMRNGKLSVLRWVLGDEWDNLDT